MKPIMWIIFCLVISFSLPANELDWKRIGPITPSISRILPDRGNPGIWYLTEIKQQRLYRSINNGKSWQYTGLIGTEDILVHPASSEVFVVLPGRDFNKLSLFSSRDSGRTFQLRCANAPRRIFAHPSNPRVLWGSGTSNEDYNLSVSTDHGAHWQNFNNLPFKLGKDYTVPGWDDPLTAEYYHLQSVLVSPFDPETIYVSTEVEFPLGCSSEFINLELISNNSGKSWSYTIQPIGNYIYDPSFPDRAFFTNRISSKILNARGWQPLPQRGFEQIVSVPGMRSVIYAVKERKQWISHDEGNSWRLTEIGPNGNARILQARISPAGSLIAGTSGGGVYVIDENRNWHETDVGLRESSIYDVESAPNSKFVYAVSAGQDSYLYRSTNAGESWKNISEKFAYPKDQNFRPRITVNPKNGRNLFVFLNGKTLVTYDGGETWNTVPQARLIKAFFDPNSSSIYFSRIQFGRLYISDDEGRTTRQLPAFLGHQKNTVLDVAVDPYTKDLYIASTRGLYLSKDNGTTAQQIATEISPDCLQCPNFQQIIALPVRGHFLTRVNESLYKSINHGVTWRRLSPASQEIQIADSKGNHLYMVGGGLLESTDGGLTWHNITGSIRHSPHWDDSVEAMTDPRYFPIYLATTFGMYKTR